MLRFFATKPKILNKIEFDANGERLVLQWSGVTKFLRLFSVASPSYLYFLYQLDRETLLGKVSMYSLPVFAAMTGIVFYKFSKFLHKLVVLQGGSVLKLEKYPFGGWGHFNKRLINVSVVDSLVAYGGKRWYNPMRMGKGFFKLKFERKILGFTVRDYVIFKIPADYDRDVLKIISVGKTVNDQNLKMIKKLNFYPDLHSNKQWL